MLNTAFPLPKSVHWLAPSVTSLLSKYVFLFNIILLGFLLSKGSETWGGGNTLFD